MKIDGNEESTVGTEIRTRLRVSKLCDWHTILRPDISFSGTPDSDGRCSTIRAIKKRRSPIARLHKSL
jgi:hypothetical protein